MKKQLKTLVTVLALTTLAAMEAGASLENTSILPVIGGNSFNYGGSGMDSRGGMILGANVFIPTNIAGLKVETGLNYLETGAKTEMFFASIETSLGYLAIPVLANWQFHKTDSGTEIYLKGGAYITQLMTAKSQAQVLGEKVETDVKDQFSSNDVLIAAGIGGSKTLFSNIQVAVDLNYAQGLVNTAKNADGKSSGWILGTSLIIPM